MKKIILIGTLIPDSLCDAFLKKEIAPQPADNAQKYILQALKNYDCSYEIEAICSPRIAPFPFSKIKAVKSSKHEESWGTLVTAGFLNIPFIGFWLREISLLRQVKKSISKSKNRDIKVIVYSLHSPFLKAAKLIKKENKDSKICVVVPDLPQHMNPSGVNAIKTILKGIDNKRIINLLSFVDSFAVYTKNMIEEIPVGQKKWDVFEGIFDTTRIDIDKANAEKYNSLTCMYAGNLDPKYGIDTLIDAFKDITCIPAKLVIYGKDINGYIEKKCDETENCIYKGLLSPQQVFVEMQRCHLLINPRPSDLELTKYSFPSKTFEYFASGTPTLMNKLSGIPEEYYNVMYCFEEESVEGYRKCLEQTLALGSESLSETGMRAKRFLLDVKNENNQVKKIIELLYD